MAYCDRCERYFTSDRALQQHVEDSSAHHVCYHCDRDFTSSHGLVQHYVQSSQHHYCQRCEEHFEDDEDLEEHFEDDHHYCRVCNQFFRNDFGLQEHNRQKHYYCAPCRQYFQNQSNLDSHTRSSKHQPRAFPCCGPGCEKSFVSVSARTAHWESGACVSGLTRERLNRLAIKYDRNNVITNPSRLIGGRQGTVVTDMWATERTWNGYAYECILCFRTFPELSRLNAHLHSPAHEDRIYHCPEGRNGCGAQFTTLSGLCQHVESESCGVHRFKGEMENLLDSLTSRMRRIAL
ncbi:hypothetical protein B0H21DRAFT_697029 [Amylocystis lapponica]|nr:hypothetical protein B0H21DRAFT_697029 [Amylocystis lapponica]